MSLIRCKDTKPEISIRQMVFALGHRYRLHVSDLPGKPDLVFSRLRKVIFVHGCFWHRHPRCPMARLPKSKLEFWLPKLSENRRRDQRVIRKLRSDGWKVLVVWECQLNDLGRVEQQVRR